MVLNSLPPTPASDAGFRLLSRHISLLGIKSCLVTVYLIQLVFRCGRVPYGRARFHKRDCLSVTSLEGPPNRYRGACGLGPLHITMIAVVILDNGLALLEGVLLCAGEHWQSSGNQEALRL